ncbi:MAG: GTPase Era, partial [Bacteroidia bacterium]
MSHKAGFVNIIGKPNVGKSTLMNALMGEKLSIITHKAQTTRHRIKGIINSENYQIVFSDTPGVIKPAYKLQKKMMSFVESAFEDADVIILLLEVGEKNVDEIIQKKISETEVPVVVALNKTDTVTPEQVKLAIDHWKKQLPGKDILPIAAMGNYNTDKLLKKIVELLPESPPYYPKDEAFSDRSERFFVSEIIREKILLYYNKEIPYSTEVAIDSFKEEDNIIRIRALIFVERDTQKGILIGHKGGPLKKVGT